MKNIDIKSLRLFVAICETGNLKSAALQEHIEPSAVSKRLANLELMCGTQLLVRNKTGAKPTPEGQAMLEHARSVLFTMSKAESELASFKKGIQGQVRLVASASAIAEKLLDDLSMFMLQPEYEKIQINIEEQISRDIVQAIKDGQAQLGICWGNVDLNGLSSLPYRSDQLVLALPTGHPLSKKKSIQFADAMDLSFVGLPASTAVSSILQREATRHGRQINYRAIVSNFDSAFRVVAAGLGASVVPKEVGEIYVQNRTICTIPLIDEWSKRRFVICFRSKEQLASPTQSLLDFLASKATY